MWWCTVGCMPDLTSALLHGCMQMEAQVYDRAHRMNLSGCESMYVLAECRMEVRAMCVCAPRRMFDELMNQLA